MAEQQEQEQRQRRRSFDDVLKDALTQWTKRFERALEEQRRELGREAEERVSKMDRATLDSPLLVLQGNDVYHPTLASRRAAELVPGATLLERWKDQADQPAARATVNDFLAGFASPADRGGHSSHPR